MKSKPEFYLGIDPTAGRSAFTWAVLDADCRLVIVAGGEMEDVIKLIEDKKSNIAVVNAPTSVNHGLVRAKLAEEKNLVNPRGADMRMAEYLLRERGVSVPPTPSRIENSPAWMQMAFDLHKKMEEIGYRLFPAGEAHRQRMETNPHAVFCALLGQVPLPKPTLEGRLQRQLVLHGMGEDITDPMDFFEEITRHRILQGSLPMEFIYTTEQLDALAAAYTAWAVINSPNEITIVGDKEEGQIYLPVKELKEKYV